MSVPTNTTSSEEWRRGERRQSRLQMPGQQVVVPFTVPPYIPVDTLYAPPTLLTATPTLPSNLHTQ